MFSNRSSAFFEKYLNYPLDLCYVLQQCRDMNTKQLIKALGRKNIADALDGVSEETVRQAAYKKQLPAEWWMGMSKLAIDLNAECPRELFKFR